MLIDKFKYSILITLTALFAGMCITFASSAYQAVNDGVVKIEQMKEAVIDGSF